MSLTQSVPLEPIAYARFLQIYRWVNLASAVNSASVSTDIVQSGFKPGAINSKVKKTLNCSAMVDSEPISSIFSPPHRPPKSEPMLNNNIADLKRTSS